MKKNIVFIGYPLNSELHSKYENRIALWKSDYDKLNNYEQVIDLGDLLNKLFGKEKDNALELELCTRIIGLIDSNTIAIVDTAMAGHSLFEDYPALYDKLNIHLKKINNKDVKIFLCEPLKFMGKVRYNSSNIEYNRLVKIVNENVFVFKDNIFIKTSDMEKHENAFIKYILNNIELFI